MTTEQPNVQTREGQEKLKEMGIKPIPSPDALTQPYWDAAKNHEIQLQYCTSCNDYQHPPRETCALCGGNSFEWKKVSGEGILHSFVIDHRLMTPGFNEPYAVLQVRPVEAKGQNAIITANLRDASFDDIKIDQPMEVLFEDLPQGVTLPQFRPKK